MRLELLIIIVLFAGSVFAPLELLAIHAIVSAPAIITAERFIL